MSLFKKPKKNLSLKSTRAADEDPEDSSVVEAPVATNVPKLSETTTTVERKITAISFVEENEDEFQIKKSDRSIRVAQQLKQEYVRSQKPEEKKSTKPVGHLTKKKQGKKSENDDDVILVGEEAAELESNNSHESAPVSFTSSLSEMMKSGVLPDANMIHLIKKKRQLMRDTGIATGQTTTGDVGAPLRIEPRREDKSALVREDDEADRSDVSDQEANDDEDGHMKMSVRQRQEDKRQKLRNDFLSAEQGSDEESDHEREWEKQQLSKGVSTMTVIDKQQTASLFSGVTSETITASTTTRLTAQSARKAMTAPKVSVAEIKGELSQHLSDLIESNRRHKFERQARADSYDYSQEEVKNAEEKTASLDQQYRFYQELLAYFADFIDCYNTKMPAIVGMEERLLTAYRQRTDRLMKRRRQDVVDQSLETAPLKPNQVPFQPDEEMRGRIADRTNRRSRRRWKRQEQGVRNHYEGWSTDDEEATSDNIKLGTERDSVRKLVAEALSEICDDFVQLDAIVSHFNDWRNEQLDSYRAAFAGLCLSKLVAPLVRLHILDWNPLEESATAIQDHVWFKTLAGYCRVDPQPTTTSEDELSILPSIVDKVVLVKLNDLVARVWDPLSLSQTKRLADLLETLATTFPTLNSNSKQLRDLISTIKKRFTEVLDSDVFMPLCTKQALADRASPLAQFFYRQLWSCIKLFVSMSRFSTLISPTVIQELMLTGLLNRYIALGFTQLETVTQEVIELYTMVMSAVPVIWFAKLPASQVTTLDLLKPFATLLFQLVGRFSAISTDPQSRAAVQMFATAVSDFFIAIHANDLASRIVSELNIQL